MADILLKKPATGESHQISSETGSRFLIEFDPNDAMLNREGDSFVFSFPDGSSIEVTDFLQDV